MTGPLDTVEQFLQFADLRPDALLLVSAAGTVLAANGGVGQRLGLAPGALAGRPLRDFVVGGQAALTGYLRACSRSRALVPGAVTLARPDADSLPCRAEGAVFRPRTDGADALILLCLVPRPAAVPHFVALNQKIEQLGREITSRRAAESALDEQRERLHTTLLSIGDAVIVTDPDGRVTLMNPVAEWLTGWSQRDAAGQPVDEVFHIVNEHTRQPVENPVTKVVRTGTVAGLANHTLLIARDGTERPIDDSGAPVRDAAGQLAGVVLVFRDITDRKRADAAQRFLAEAGEVLASSLDYEETLAAVARFAVPHLADWCSVTVALEGEPPRQLAVAHVDPAKVQWARELAHRYPPDLNAPRGMPEVLRSGRSEVIAEITDAMILAGARDAEHLEIIRSLGLKSIMTVPLNARGRTLGAITFVAAESGRRYGDNDLALAEDLARRAAVAVDNARLYRDAQEALRLREEAARQLAVLVEASGSLTSSLDLPAVQTAVLELSNRLIAADAYAIWRMRTETGFWEIAEAAGLSVAYRTSAGRVPIPPEDVPSEPTVAEDVQAAAPLEGRRAAYRAEGIASLLSVPLRFQGRVAGTLTFYYRNRQRFNDVTIRLATAIANLAGSALETAELYQRESALRLRAEEADRRKDEFLALLGHELRNPLAPIKNAVSLLTLRADDPAVVVQARDMIGRQAGQMTRLVDELLDASRIARGKVRLTTAPLDLAALVREAVADHRAGVEAAGLRLDVEMPAVPVWVLGDDARLAQVIGNLLHNASKFTDPGGRVTVRLEESNGQAVLAVADTGVGISPEALPKLFEVFSQVDATLERSKGGLGLGLSVVKGLVELHGGGVRAASAGPGHGATFTLRLPLVARPEPATTANDGGPGLHAKPCKVLIVEDGRDTAESLRLLLSLHGFEVAVAHTGPEGVAAAQQLRPDVVVCDLGLPGMSGFEVARALRAERATAGATLICVSGYGQEEDRRKARAVGFNEVLVKPVDPEVLVRLLAGIRPEPRPAGHRR